MSEVETNTEERREKFFEGVAKKGKGRPKKDIIMTWGKYKGKLVKDIITFDRKYAYWLYRQEYISKFEDIYKTLKDHFKDNDYQDEIHYEKVQEYYK